jgi:hypothetical protein
VILRESLAIETNLSNVDGSIGIAMSAAITAPIGSFVNAYPNKKLLNYGFAEQIKDVLPSFILSVAMGGCVFALSCAEFAVPSLQLILLMIAGGCIYLGFARLLKLECLEYIVSAVKERRKNNGN